MSVTPSTTTSSKATQSDSKHVVGLDGCRAGWIAQTLWLRPHLSGSTTFEVSHTEWHLIQEQEDLLGVLQRCDQAWIDVPIGLASSTDDDAPKRACDLAVREALGSKRSSIFTPPIRDVLEIASYHEAMQRQHELIGAKCSIQAWNLTPKIRQMDTLWEWIDDAEHRIHEAHPEWQFQCWVNGLPSPSEGDSQDHVNNLLLEHSHGNPSLSSKKTDEGRRQRLAILASLGFDDASSFYEDCLSQTKRKDVQPDDIMDAMALAWGCYQAMNGYGKILPEAGTPKDAKGRPMAIHYASP
ncbi:MAG: DUF429 domain-containing protein [Balneolaceae bacterium]|nr:DUF429 domain-containing protein [Balneolaceae bacterium]